MEIGSILLIAALALLVALFISRPFFDRASRARLVEAGRGTAQADHEHSTLLAERDRVLNALQELDFDNAVGKIPPEDYPAQRAALLQAGAEILHRLDAFQPETRPESAEDRLEAAVASRRADSRERPRLPAADQDELEALIAARRRARQEKAAGFCPKCGRPLQKSDQFCSSCGAPITA
jgi:NADH pyrophosphatase NudC (nudix superfamily)